jgi:general secretion pathway protein G
MVTMKAIAKGFTMIELMVALAIIAMLLTLVAPRYLNQEARARDTALFYNLQMLRKTLDDYRSDKGQYPKDLQTLVDARYLRAIPIDPITGSSNTWRTVTSTSKENGIYDIKSGAQGLAADGSNYADW